MKLLDLLSPFRSQIIAGVGVLAVCGVGATCIAWIHIQRLNDQIETRDGRIEGLEATNKNWAAHAAEQDRLRSLEQQNVLLLQDKLALIEQQNTSAAAQLKDLETSNAEVRELMAQRLPADLRRLLEQQK